MDDDQQPSLVTSRRLLPMTSSAARDARLWANSAAAATDQPGVLTGARCRELRAEVACEGRRRDQRQSGFSPETPVISSEIRGIGGTRLARQK
jgi:hypothetical protein